MPYVGYLTGTAPVDYENEQNQEFSLISEKFNANQSIKEFRYIANCKVFLQKWLDCNWSKNPKEKKDQQVVDDEDLDDVLKKASNANNNDVRRLKAGEMDS